MFSRGRTADRSDGFDGAPTSARHAATAPDDNVIFVSPAQVKAARLLVDLAGRRNEPVDPAVLAIANAKKANGHVQTSAEASNRPLPAGPATPSVA